MTNLWITHAWSLLVFGDQKSGPTYLGLCSGSPQASPHVVTGAAVLSEPRLGKGPFPRSLRTGSRLVEGQNPAVVGMKEEGRCVRVQGWHWFGIRKYRITKHKKLFVSTQHLGPCHPLNHWLLFGDWKNTPINLLKGSRSRLFLPCFFSKWNPYWSLLSCIEHTFLLKGLSNIENVSWKSTSPRPQPLMASVYLTSRLYIKQKRVTLHMRGVSCASHIRCFMSIYKDFIFRDTCLLSVTHTNLVHLFNQKLLMDI